MHLIQQNIEKINPLCQKYKVKNMYVFGSILTSRFKDESDLDLLVKFSNELDYLSYADNILDLFADLKNLFDRNVDLVDVSSIRNHYFKKEVTQTMQLIYPVMIEA